MLKGYEKKILKYTNEDDDNIDRPGPWQVQLMVTATLACVRVSQHFCTCVPGCPNTPHGHTNTGHTGRKVSAVGDRCEKYRLFTLIKSVQTKCVAVWVWPGYPGVKSRPVWPGWATHCSTRAGQVNDSYELETHQLATPVGKETDWSYPWCIKFHKFQIKSVTMAC